MLISFVIHHNFDIIKSNQLSFICLIYGIQKELSNVFLSNQPKGSVLPLPSLITPIVSMSGRILPAYIIVYVIYLLLRQTQMGLAGVDISSFNNPLHRVSELMVKRTI